MAEIQTCGHPASEIVGSDEGTHYCAACEREAHRPVEGQTEEPLSLNDFKKCLSRFGDAAEDHDYKGADRLWMRLIGSYRALAAARQDMADAAGELLLPLPQPGSDMAKLLTANVLLRRENEQLRREIQRLQVAVSFARSAIKSGESWTPTCDEILSLTPPAPEPQEGTDG